MNLHKTSTTSFRGCIVPAELPQPKNQQKFNSLNLEQENKSHKLPKVDLRKFVES